jgi:2-(1,2-epoxy-1,2-dihydrophenyl)acetyl-CoA isomerase
MTQVLLSEMRGGLMVLTMNRPESRNALNPALCLALAERLAAAAADPAVRTVVLAGAGGTFCVGGDVKAMNEGSGRDAPEAERIANLRARMEASRLLHEMPKPTIAAIEGAAAGAGLSLALACDFRICASTAKLTTAFAKVGLSGDYGGTYFLTQILGSAKARDLYLRSPVLTGEEAHRLGLVTELAEPGRVLEAAIAFAAPLAEGPTVTLGKIKQNLALASGGGSLAQCFDEEARNHVACTATADHKEAAAAFVQKRKPVFAGR